MPSFVVTLFKSYASLHWCTKSFSWSHLTYAHWFLEVVWPFLSPSIRISLHLHQLVALDLWCSWLTRPRNCGEVGMYNARGISITSQNMEMQIAECSSNLAFKWDGLLCLDGDWGWKHQIGGSYHPKWRALLVMGILAVWPNALTTMLQFLP